MHSFDRFILTIRRNGRYSFGLQEFKDTLDLSDKSANQMLYRAKMALKIVQVRKGFYVVLTPEYSVRGIIPASLFIDDLMNLLYKRYYVGLFSAAALYGAAHHQPMETFVIIEKPAMRPILINDLKINFLVKKSWKDEFIIKKKTEAGYIRVSSPELTALDLFYYVSEFSILYLVTVLKELLEEIKVSRMYKAALEYPEMATIQRLGFIMDVVLKKDSIADALEKGLRNKKIYPVRLDNQKLKEGEYNHRWKVFQNTTIEVDI
jgi:predicted transcriptional regulator of viral defense system